MLVIKPLKVLRQVVHASLLGTVLAGVAVGSSGCASTRTQESTGQYFDDAAITTRVKAAFVEDKAVSAARINVETFKGVVQLSGFANNQAEIDQAVALARAVSGVKDVKNDIRLK